MSFLDLLVMGVYACLMLGIGWYYSRQNRTADDYLLGARRMSPVALGLSLFATLVSTLTYIGVPGEVAAYGPMLMTQSLAHPFVYVIVGFGLIPLIMRQPVTSAYELLEKRLGTSIRLAGAGVFLLLRLLWMATILYATSDKVLVPMLKLDRSWVPWLCVGLGVVIAAYSSLGGFRAVVLTDALQALTMLAGAILTIAVITVQMKGVEGWWPATWPDHWEAPKWGFDPEARFSMGILVLSSVLWYVCTNGSDQMSIQRFLSTRDAAQARKALFVSQVTDVIVAVLLGLTGVAVLGFYQTHPSRLPAGMTLRTMGDNLFPTFIMSELPPGVSGLVLTAIISAALSSLSSGVNSACAVLERDFISRRVETARSDAQADLFRLKRLTWVVAVAAVALGIMNVYIEGNLIERCFKLVNLLSAPLFVLFFLALFVRWSNAVGGWLGLLSSAATAVVVAFSKELGLDLGVSFIWMMPCSLVVGITVGMAGSLLGKSRTVGET